jgi:quercetin dioxygenase-like cupin family protein
MRNQKTDNGRRALVAALILLNCCLHEAAHAQTNPVTASPAPGTTKPPMHSKVFQWSDMQALPSAFGTVRNVFDAPTPTLENFSCHVTTLDPGKAPHPPHRHPEEELVIVKEGTLEVMQNGVTNQVSAGGMVFCASNELHGWRNRSDKPVTYYVIHVSPHDLVKPVPAGEQKPNK